MTQQKKGHGKAGIELAEALVTDNAEVVNNLRKGDNSLLEVELGGYDKTIYV